MIWVVLRTSAKTIINVQCGILSGILELDEKNCEDGFWIMLYAINGNDKMKAWSRFGAAGRRDAKS
jgi:hypothetical protein